MAMARSTHVLALDGGGTKTAAALFTAAGERLSHLLAGPCNLYQDPDGGIAVIRSVWVEILGISLLMIFGYHLALNIGETKIPAGPAGLIIGTYPIFTLLFAALLIKEKLTWQKALGGLLGFTGIAILVFNGSKDLSPENQIETAEWIKYGLITLIAPVAAAFQTILSKTLLTGENRAGVKLNPAHAMLLFMIPAIVLLPFVSFIPDFPNPLTLSEGFWWALALLVFGSTFISYLGWMWAIKFMGAGRTAATTTYAIPLVSLVIAWIFLGEKIGPMTMVSAVLVIAGMIITNLNGGNGAKTKKQG